MNSNCWARSRTLSCSLSAVARRCVFSWHSSFKFGKLPMVSYCVVYVFMWARARFCLMFCYRNCFSFRMKKSQLFSLTRFFFACKSMFIFHFSLLSVSPWSSSHMDKWISFFPLSLTLTLFLSIDSKTCNELCTTQRLLSSVGTTRLRWRCSH